MNQSPKTSPNLTNWKNALILILIVGLLGYQWYQNRKAGKQEQAKADSEKAAKVEDDKYAVKFKPPIKTEKKDKADDPDIAKVDQATSQPSQTVAKVDEPKGNSDRKLAPPVSSKKDPVASTKVKENSGSKASQSAATEKAAPADDGSFLKPAGGKNLKSPAGLIYGMGPRGEHRVDHVMRHGEDDTSRPSHGVFVGDKEKILKNIDEAYELVKKKSNKVQTEESNGNTAYTISMGRKVGYEGGEKGKRNGNRALNSIRLVLDGDRVVTAYPYR